MGKAKNTEERAISAIKAFLASVPGTDAVVDSNDRTPDTDGFIDLYADDTSPSDVEFIGRFYIQVKGRTVRDGRNLRTVNMSRNKVERIRKLGGLLLLAVALPKTASPRGGGNIYFNLLTPSRCSHFLTDHQKTTIAIPVDELNIDDPLQVRRLVEIGIEHSKNQAAPPYVPIFDPESKVEVFSAKPFDFTRKTTVLDSQQDDFVIYHRTKTGYRYPQLAGLFVLIQSHEVHDISISAGEVVYRQPKSQVLADGTGILELSPALSLSIHDDSDKLSVKFNIEKSSHHTFSDVYRAFTFMRNLRDSGQFKVDDRALHGLWQTDTDQTIFDREFAILERFHTVFSTIGVTEEILTFDDIAKIDISSAEKLVDVISSNDVEALTSESTGLLSVNFGAKKILLFIDNASIHIPFLLPNGDGGAIVATRLGGDAPRLCTFYEALNAEDYFNVANTNLRQIVDHYNLLSEQTKVADLANRSGLQLLDCGDSHSELAGFYYRMADRLFEWASTDRTVEAIANINKLQVAKRLRVLTDKEQLKARTLRDSFTTTIDSTTKWMRSTAAILLEDTPELEFQLESMTAAERESFFDLPIWTLAKGTARLESVVAKHSEPSGQFPLIPTEVRLAIESMNNSANPE